MNTGTASSGWHAGERALQSRAGVANRMAELGSRVLRDHMPEQHRAFFAQLPFLVTGSIDDEDQPWASVLAAPPGFAHSPDPRHLRVDALPAPGNPLGDTLHAGASIALLGIEPHTRRRNRLNGWVTQRDAGGFSVEVGQSFGNCPKYIQARAPVFVEDAVAAPRWHASTHMDEAARRMVASADTFYIATAHPLARHGTGDMRAMHGVDVSHRGGRPGFVRLDGDRTLSAPDFAGNFFFNTLGNIAIHAKAGLLFIDFANGDLLHLAVNAQVIWDGPEVEAFAGAQRLLRMQVESVLHRPGALPLRWGAAELSPHLEGTGDWHAAT